MPQSRYTTTVELEAQQAAIRQILARNAQVEPVSDDTYALRTSLAASIAHEYRRKVTS